MLDLRTKASRAVWFPLADDDRPLRREHDTAFPRELQRVRQLCIAVTSEVGIFERSFRDDQHVPEAPPGLDEEDLGSLIEDKEIAMQAISELPLKELPNDRHAAFIERPVMTPRWFGGQVPAHAIPTLPSQVFFGHCQEGVLQTPCPNSSDSVARGYEQRSGWHDWNDDASCAAECSWCPPPAPRHYPRCRSTTLIRDAGPRCPRCGPHKGA